jgi:phosphoglycolate phosphatase-like HAD superfamily hydrolase
MLPAAIVFDFDGVIANSEPLHLEAFQQVLATIGVHLPALEYYERYLGYDDEGAFRAVLGDRGLEVRDDEVARLIADKAVLLPGLTVTLTMEGETQTWCYANGLAEYLGVLADGNETAAPGFDPLDPDSFGSGLPDSISFAFQQSGQPPDGGKIRLL